METKLTVKEALEQGYTHCGEEGDEYIRSIEDMDDDYFENSVYYLVDKDNSYSFTISAESIAELIIERLIDEQDEVSDPDGKLSELASGADFKKLADDINERMASKKFRDLTDIQLIP